MDKKDFLAYLVGGILLALCAGIIIGAIISASDWHSALDECENRHQENSYCCANAEFFEGRMKAIEDMLNWCYGELAQED